MAERVATVTWRKGEASGMTIRKLNIFMDEIIGKFLAAAIRQQKRQQLNHEAREMIQHQSLAIVIDKGRNRDLLCSN